MKSITTRLKPDLSFEATNQFDKILINDELKVGEIYKCVFSKPRRLKSNGYYWVLLSAISYFNSSGDKDYWHDFFMKHHYGVDMIYNKFSKQQEVVRKKSTAFENMDELEFKKHIKFVVDFLDNHGLNADALINEYKNRGE